jgi:hypothetical protein
MSVIHGCITNIASFQKLSYLVIGIFICSDNFLAIPFDNLKKKANVLVHIRLIPKALKNHDLNPQ